MRTPGRITTIALAGVLATVGTGAAASAAGPAGTCDGTGAGAGPGAKQGQTQQRQAQQRAGDRAGRLQMRGRRGARVRAVRLPARTNAAPLSAAEAAAVTYMREEEKLARDVYTKLAGTAGLPVFARIAVSEQRHMDAMGKLIVRYRLADPAKGKAPGEFQNAALQKLYDELVAQGTQSTAAAIQVGITIEQRDIADLKERMEISKHSDLTRVLQNLSAASQNHLRAFTAQAG